MVRNNELEGRGGEKGGARRVGRDALAGRKKQRGEEGAKRDGMVPDSSGRDMEGMSGLGRLREGRWRTEGVRRRKRSEPSGGREREGRRERVKSRSDGAVFLA